MRKDLSGQFGAKPGWLFLTGNYDEIDRLRHELGVYDLDPEIDADKTQHSGILTFGNDHTDRWTALPVLMQPQQLAKTILDTTRDDRWPMRRPISTNTDDGLSSASVRGIVRDIDTAGRTVTIEHEDIPGLMMAMTMQFELTDSVDLKKLRSGETVIFEAEQQANGLAIRNIRAAVTENAMTTVATDGSADYETYCATCHGRRGNGDGPVAELLTVQPARHSDAVAMASLTDEQLFLAIRDGGPAIGKSRQMGA